MRRKAYILQNFCIIDSMKLYNQQFPSLYNTFYQAGGKNFARGAGPPGPSPDYDSVSNTFLFMATINVLLLINNMTVFS